MSQLPWWGGKEPWGVLGAGTALCWQKGLREGVKTGEKQVQKPQMWAAPHTCRLGWCWARRAGQTAAWQAGKEFLPERDLKSDIGLMTCGLMTCGVNDLDIPLSEVYLRPWTHSSNELQNPQVKLFPTSISVCPGAWKAEHRVCACPS